jgi:hypothetical protein
MGFWDTIKDYGKYTNPYTFMLPDSGGGGGSDDGKIKNSPTLSPEQQQFFNDWTKNYNKTINNYQDIPEHSVTSFDFWGR